MNQKEVYSAKALSVFVSGDPLSVSYDPFSRQVIRDFPVKYLVVAKTSQSPPYMPFSHVFLFVKIRISTCKTGGLLMKKVVFIICLSVLLAGCGDRLTEIKDAASGINAAADSAASAISPDVHSVRAITIAYNDNTFTINDLFKTILRDTRWEYDAHEGKLQVMGTWMDPLFSEQQWDDAYKRQLAEYGEITVTCVIQNGKINSTLTDVKLVFKGDVILHLTGKDALYHLYETYSQK